MLILVALGSVLLLGLVGLAIDGGQAFVNRRNLQAAADSSSEAGARMLLSNVSKSGGPSSGNYSDADVKSVVCTVATGTQPSGGASLPCANVVAYYTDSSASHLGTVGAGTIPAGSVGVEVTAQDTSHPTYIVRLFGSTNAQEAATSAASYNVVQSLDVSAGYTGPWVVWHTSCTTATTIKVGDDIVFRSNGFAATGACNDPAFAINGNGFKGFLKFEDNCAGGTVVVAGGNACSSSGNAIGQEPTKQIVDAYNNHTPLLLPVIDSASKQAGVNQFHILGFVALTPDQAWTSPSQGDWTGTIVGFVPAGYGGNCPSSQVCPAPPSYTPSSVGLSK